MKAIAIQEENERKVYEAMTKAAVDVLQKSGGEILSISNFNTPVFNHQLGGCRMGSDPRTSVLNSYCGSHDVPNLYVVDGSVFPSSSEKNPTLTIMALAARAADNRAGHVSGFAAAGHALCRHLCGYCRPGL